MNVYFHTREMDNDKSFFFTFLLTTLISLLFIKIIFGIIAKFKIIMDMNIMELNYIKN